MSKSSQLDQMYRSLESSASQLPLATQPTDIIPGEGNPDAQVVFIGEAPGYNEHVQRRPFVGRSGKLLRQTLTDVGFPPAEVYISNIIKVRPPENRDPTPAEILAYKPCLDAEIEIIQPLLIATLGRYSMAKFLPGVYISQVHGRLHQVVWNGQKRFVLPLYHPAAALRSTTVKDAFVHDLEKLPKILAWISQKKADDDSLAEIVEVLL